MVTPSEGRDPMTIDLQFLVVLCKNVYNSVLGKAFASTLYIVPSSIHRKLKYHNIWDEQMTIRAKLSKEKG